MNIKNSLKNLFVSGMIVAGANAYAHGADHDGHEGHATPQQNTTTQSISFDIAGLQKEDNTTLKANEYDDKKQFWFFGFTNCPHICPVDMANIHAALREIKAENGDEAFNTAIENHKFYMLSVDPDRDTPKAMDEWINNFGDIFEGITAVTEQQEAQLNTVKTSARALVGGNYQSHKSFVYVIDGDNKTVLDKQNAFGSHEKVHDQLVEFFSENLGLDAPEQNLSHNGQDTVQHMEHH
ncbi:MAG: SCO family protein [Alphaproteobacteria bacterium]